MGNPATQFKPGNPGKQKGTIHHSTRIVKEVFADVFSKLQNDKKAKLEQWAKDNPTEFYKLASKLIPVQLAGDAENPIIATTLSDTQFSQLIKAINEAGSG